MAEEDIVPADEFGVQEMITAQESIPPGPAGTHHTSAGLLEWMGQQFETFGDVFTASLDGVRVYATRDPDHAYHVLVRNWQNYTKGRMIKRIALLLGNGLMVSEGEFWKRQRRMAQPAFHREAVGGFAKLILAANLELREKWERAAERGASVNVTRDVSDMVMTVVLQSIFGDDYDQAAPHLNALAEDSERNLAFAQSFRALRNVVREVVRQRRDRAAAGGDILGMLLAARDRDTGNGMTDSQVVNEVMTLVVAGHETTASTLNWTWYLLSQHPEIEERLACELADPVADYGPSADDLARFPYARQIIDEALRLYPAGWLLTRKALKDDRLGEYLVPKGAEIYISPYFIQRHPRLWKDPDRFDPDRFGAARAENAPRLATLPFSAGPRNCIGEALARIEMQIHLIVIARRLWLRHIPTEPIALEAGVNLRSRHPFMMAPVLKRGPGREGSEAR
jgi:cytochrome P450